MTTDNPLIPLPDGAAAIDRSRQTLTCWQKKYPDLGVTIGGRQYSWRAALAAIATGTSLPEAAAIGRQERDRYTVAVQARIGCPAREQVAA